MKHNKRKFAKILLFTIALMAGLFVIFDSYTRADYQQPVEKVVTVDNLARKITEIKAESLEALKQCESAGHSEDDGIIIFDSNNKASIGQFQFQKDTVIHYYKVLYNQDVSKKDAVLIALDTEKAQKLAHDVIFTTEKGWTNWMNCAKKTGLTDTLRIIAKLES